MTVSLAVPPSQVTVKAVCPVIWVAGTFVPVDCVENAALFLVTDTFVHCEVVHVIFAVPSELTRSGVAEMSAVGFVSETTAVSFAEPPGPVQVIW